MIVTCCVCWSPVVNTVLIVGSPDATWTCCTAWEPDMVCGRDITMIFCPGLEEDAIVCWPGKTLTMEVPGDWEGVDDRCCCMMTNFWPVLPAMVGVVGVRGMVSPGWILADWGVCGVPGPPMKIWGFPCKTTLYNYKYEFLGFKLYHFYCVVMKTK